MFEAHAKFFFHSIKERNESVKKRKRKKWKKENREKVRKKRTKRKKEKERCRTETIYKIVLRAWRNQNQPGRETLGTKSLILLICISVSFNG